MNQEQTSHALARTMAVLFGCVTGFILILNLLKSCFPRVLYQYYQLETLLPHPVLMLTGLVVLTGLFLLIRTIGRRCHPTRWWKLSERSTLLLAGALFFATQMYLIYNYCFETDWDVQVLLDSARCLANGQRPNHNGWYYSCYPNNLFLTAIFGVILWVTKPLHLGALDFLSIVAVQSLFCVVTGWMLYQIMVHRWKRRDLACFGMALYLLLVGLSPWTSIPYSDAWGLLFPIAALWAYDCSALKEKPFLRWFLIIFCAFFGFKIKPQVIFVLLSILGVDLGIAWLHRKERGLIQASTRRSLLGGVAGAVAVLLPVFLINSVSHIGHYKDSRFGAPHFLMMGLNRESIGDYSDYDVIFARQFTTARERDKAELKESWKRLREMGPKGFGQLVCEKTLVNYYDGTFFWGKEGYFYKTVFPERNRHLSPFLRNLYYNRTIHGAYYPYWCSGATAIWLGALALMFFAAFGRPDRLTFIVMLSLLLLTLYETFFEARARYLYAYLPFYIFLAVQGIRQLEQGVSRLRHRKRQE